jgi:hypothetical protein
MREGLFSRQEAAKGSIQGGLAGRGAVNFPLFLIPGMFGKFGKFEKFTGDGR